MSARSKIEKWLLADWSTGNVPAVGEDVKVMSLQPNESTVADEIMVYERPLLEQQLRLTKADDSVSKEENVPHGGRDYSPSCSSWAPSDAGSSSEESENEKETKAIKIEQYMRHYAKRRNGKNGPIPVHRPNAVVNVLKERQNNVNNKSKDQNRKRKYKETRGGNKSLPDSTKKNLPVPKSSSETISVNKKNILDMKASFDELFKIINDMKPLSEWRTPCLETGNIYLDNAPAAQPVAMDEDITMNNPVYNNTEAYDESDKSQSEESNRSDDNVLISNKYSKVRELTEEQHQQITNKQQNTSHNEVDEWVPIGSGKTLIHKDKFRKVNWKSYTIATRTLLLATFPRRCSPSQDFALPHAQKYLLTLLLKLSKGEPIIRILATHSLTGKRSPAFLDKPAKMCLDPKIVSDIIIEITSKFNVKENLVRSAITTKCADECKMYKTRIKNKNKSIKDQENALHSIKNSKLETKQVKTE